MFGKKKPKRDPKAFDIPDSAEPKNPKSVRRRDRWLGNHKHPDQDPKSRYNEDRDKG